MFQKVPLRKLEGELANSRKEGKKEKEGKGETSDTCFSLKRLRQRKKKRIFSPKKGEKGERPKPSWTNMRLHAGNQGEEATAPADKGQELQNLRQSKSSLPRRGSVVDGRREKKKTPYRSGKRRGRVKVIVPSRFGTYDREGRRVQERKGLTKSSVARKSLTFSRERGGKVETNREKGSLGKCFQGVPGKSTTGRTEGEDEEKRRLSAAREGGHNIGKRKRRCFKDRKKKKKEITRPLIHKTSSIRQERKCACVISDGGRESQAG